MLTADNPELQYPFQFEEYDREERKFPLSEELTLRNSKQRIKFSNYGGMLALAYFLNDYQVFDEDHPHLGLVISNEEVK